MKKCALVIASLLFILQVYGQSELIFGHESKHQSLILTNCTIDNQDNLYLLANAIGFDTAYGMLMPSFTVGNTIVKIDAGGGITWSKDLPCDYPGDNAILLDDSLYIPSGIGIGYNICATVPDTLYKLSNINTFYKTPLDTGSSTDILLPYGTNCGINTILCSYYQDNEFHYLYTNDSQLLVNAGLRFLSAKTNRSLNDLESTEVTTLSRLVDNNNYLIGLHRDTIANAYLICDRYGVHVFTDNWQEIRYIDIRTIYPNLSGIGEINITYNRDYYCMAISARITTGLSTKEVLIFSREGRFISQKTYAALPVIALDKNNRLVSAETIDTLDTATHPILVREMNLLQDVLSEKQVGKPASQATFIGITNNDEVIVGGTVYFRVNTPPSPYELYLYKSKLTDATNDACKLAHFFPNPASKTLSVVCGTTVSAASLSIYDLTGRQIVQQSFTKQSLDIDVSMFPQAQYILKLTNNAGNCVTKFDKL